MVAKRLLVLALDLISEEQAVRDNKVSSFDREFSPCGGNLTDFLKERRR